MRKSTRLLAVLLAFCMAFGLFTGCDKNRSATIDIASYSDAISALQDTTAELTAELEAVNKSIEQLESSTDLENIATLEMLKETKATLEEQILSANATIETLKSENTSNAEKIASLESAKTSLNNEVAAMRTRLNSMTSGAKGDKGDTGAAGVDGKDGTTPRLRINAETNMWEVSYDNGVTWTSMGSTATGANGANGTNGADGKDGITPRLQINAKTNMWEVSYDNGATWTSMGIAATGAAGADAVAPQLRINRDTREWEVSYDGGTTWMPLGAKVPESGEGAGTGVIDVTNLPASDVTAAKEAGYEDFESLKGTNAEKTYDETAQIQDIIDYYADKTAGAVLYFPKTEHGYAFKGIGLRKGVSLESDGATLSAIKWETEMDKTKYSAFMYCAENGDVRDEANNWHIEGFLISGCSVGTAMNEGQDGIAMIAMPNSSGTGGFWHCAFRDLVIAFFPGTGIKIYCNDQDAGGKDMANQYLRFEQVNVYPAMAGAKALEITGQLGQTSFDTCEFVGMNGSVPGTSADDSIVQITSLRGQANDQVFGALRFENCTFQTAEYGVKATFATNLVFEGCWFEDITHGVTLTDETTATFYNSHFSMIGDVQGLDGWGIQMGEHCTLFGMGNDLIGPRGQFVCKVSGDTEIYGFDFGTVSWGDHGNINLEVTNTYTLTSASSSLNTHKMITANLMAEDENAILSTITSELSDGGTLTLVNRSKDHKAIISSAGNIVLPGDLTSLKLGYNESVVLMASYYNGNRTYHVVSHTASETTTPSLDGKTPVNLVKIPNFQNGTASQQFAVLRGINPVFNNDGSLTLTGAKNADGSDITPVYQYINADAGDALFYSIKIKYSGDMAPTGYQLMVETENGFQYVAKNTNVSTEYTTVCANFTSNGKQTSIWNRTDFVNENAVDGAALTYYQPYCVNLTKLFGKGQEPSADWCRKNLTFDKVRVYNPTTAPSGYNAIINPFFDTSAGGWAGLRCAASSQNGVLTLTGNTDADDANLAYVYTSNVAADAGDIIYYAATMTDVSGTVSSMEIGFEEAGRQSFPVSKASPGTTNSYRLSSFYIAKSSSGISLWNKYEYANRSAVANQQVKLQDVVAVNLTTTFGKGQEPTYEWCCQNLIPSEYVASPSFTNGNIKFDSADHPGYMPEEETAATALPPSLTDEMPEDAFLGEAMELNAMTDVEQILELAQAGLPDGFAICGWLVDAGHGQQLYTSDDLQALLNTLHEMDLEYTVTITPLYQLVGNDSRTDEPTPDNEVAESNPGEEATYPSEEATDSSEEETTAPGEENPTNV